MLTMRDVLKANATMGPVRLDDVDDTPERAQCSNLWRNAGKKG